VLLVRPPSLRSYPGRIQIESVVLGSFAVDVNAESQLSREVEVLWVTPKAIMLDAAVGLAPPEQVRRAAVVPLMNGIDHVAWLRGRYELVVAGAIRVESERGPDWRVHQKTPFIRVELGPGGEEIAGELRAAGIECTVRDDEAEVLWQKLAFLAPVALTTSASASRSVPCATIHSGAHGSKELRRRSLRSPARRGSRSTRMRSVPSMATVPGATQSSMQKDVAAGHQPELDAIAGPILRGGARATAWMCS